MITNEIAEPVASEFRQLYEEQKFGMPVRDALMNLTERVPLVVRGATGHGAIGTLCKACHHTGNFDAGSVPGHPDWHLAPATMAWQNRSLAQVCAQIKDRNRNGGRDLAALIRHVSEDSLVGWAWAPGAGRTPAPGTQARFGDLMKAWVETGAVCPP